MTWPRKQYKDIVVCWSVPLFFLFWRKVWDFQKWMGHHVQENFGGLLNERHFIVKRGGRFLLERGALVETTWKLNGRSLSVNVTHTWSLRLPIIFIFRLYLFTVVFKFLSLLLLFLWASRPSMFSKPFGFCLFVCCLRNPLYKTSELTECDVHWYILDSPRMRLVTVVHYKSSLTCPF